MSKTMMAGAALLAAFTLTACDDYEEPQRNVEAMSCNELAYEIGRLDAQLRNARADAFESDIDWLAADTEGEEASAVISSLVDDARVGTYTEELQVYRNAALRKGCR